MQIYKHCTLQAALHKLRRVWALLASEMCCFVCVGAASQMQLSTVKYSRGLDSSPVLADYCTFLRALMHPVKHQS